MNPLKKLVGQTAVYGLSSIIGRVLNYLLVPLYTRVLSEATYGSVGELYAYIALVVILLTYGMETAFFRFAETTGKISKTFGTTFISILSTSVIFLIFIFAFQNQLADLAEYSHKPEYIAYLAIILVIDALIAIPFAKLRLQNRAIKFMTIKLSGIFSNIGLNLFFILFMPWLIRTYGDYNSIQYFSNYFQSQDIVDYIFISNVISSAIMLIMFLPELVKQKFEFDIDLWKKMIVYALPLLIFGMAGAINEVIDRILLKNLLPKDIAMSEVGIYSAVYKISLLMTIFIQAYKYAAEPFFFAQEKHKEAKIMYANMMKYFVMVTSLIFLGTMLYMDIIILFIGEDFRSGADVIPILLIANLFLGVYYNLSVWYKLTNKTKYGAYISVIGAFITLALNFYWIPRISYEGSAWATFVCYGSMMLISYFWGKKHYHIPYNVPRIIFYIGLSVVIYLMSTNTGFETFWVKISFNTILLLLFICILFFMEFRRFIPSKKRNL